MIKKIDMQKDGALLEKFEQQVVELKKTITELEDKGYMVNIYSPHNNSNILSALVGYDALDRRNLSHQHI